MTARLFLLWALGIITILPQASGQISQAPSCGIDPSPGIRVRGQVLQGWRAVKNAGILSITSFNNEDIAGRYQAQNASSAAECNCRCSSVKQCVGYTWLGANSQQCWLHSYIDWTNGFSSTYLDWANNTQVQVASDAVVARGVKSTDWPLCKSIVGTEGVVFSNSSADKIRKPVVGLVNASICNQACGNDAFCLGYQFSRLNTSNRSEVSTCTLLSSVGPTEDAELTADNRTVIVAVLNNCPEDLPATSDSKLPTSLDVPPPRPTPPPPKYMANSSDVGTCGIDARPGIRYQGKVWNGFANQFDVGAQVIAPDEPSAAPSVFTSFISTRDIPSKLQGLFLPDPQNCNCKCVEAKTCVGYVWLGDAQTCWLLSWISFWADPTDTFTDYSIQQQPVIRNVHPNTVSARVVKHSDKDAAEQRDVLFAAFGTPVSTNFTCGSLLAYTNKAFKNASSDNITRQPDIPVVYLECNAACLSDPYCLAFTWSSLNFDEKAACTLLSDVSGGLVDVAPGATTQNFAAVLQTCSGDRLNVSNTFKPVNVTAPTDTTASCGVNSSAGIRAKGLVWRNWVPVYGFGGDLKTTFAGAPEASNAFIADKEQGKMTATIDDCNCRCAANAACIGWTWLGGGRKECWLHSAINFWTTPVSTFLDPNNNSTSLPTLVPDDTVIGRVVFPPGSTRAKNGCGVTTRASAIVEAFFKDPITTGLTQPDRLLTFDQCNTACLTQPRCTQYIYQTKAPSLGLDLANCTLVASSSDISYVNVPPSLDIHFYAAAVQVCSDALNATPPAPSAPAPSSDSNDATIASWTAGQRHTGVVWAGWRRVYRAGWQTSDGTSWNDTSSSSGRRLQAVTTTGIYSNNYIPDDKQAFETATARECNQHCATIPSCIAYTWLGGSIRECWLHSWVQFWATTADTYIDANGIAQPVPQDTVVGRVIKSVADWSPCRQPMNWFPKLGPVIGIATRIRRPNPINTSDVSACNAECGRDPACIAFSFQGPVPVDGSPVTCVLYSDITGGLAFRSSRSGISYTVPLQACPKDLQALLGPAPSPPASSTAPAPSSSKKHLSSGAIIGIVVGSVLGVLAIPWIIAVIWARRSTQKQRKHSYWPFGNKSSISGDTTDSVWSLGMTGGVGKHVPMVIPGLARGEIFTRATAYEYAWLMQPMDDNQVQAVEANINDKQLDSMMKNETNLSALPPVVELSRDDLKNNVQLVHGGLLGRGATALVFQCVWPSRFGPNSLLAMKVLKDGHEVDPMALESFAYEANVLASTEHPCVVRLYGYCLEPPTVCLILELLPYSLKDLLYGIQTQADSTARAMHPSLRGLSLNSSKPLLLTHFTNTSGTQLLKSEAPVVVVVNEDRNSTTAYAPAAATSGDASSSTTQTLPSSLETGSSFAVPLLKSADSSSCIGATIPSPTAGPMLSLSPGSKPPPLSMLQVVRISAEIAAGLAYLHDRQLYNVTDQAPGHAVVTLESSSGMTTTMNQQGLKIVHRDLKPANILMNSQGRAKISDFGLARKTHRTTVHTERLGAGTLPYMAPELLAGANSGNTYKLAPTNRVDIYSLSMMIWEMISGKQPWSDKNEVAIMSAVIRNQRPELPQMPREVMEGPKPDLGHLPASLYALPEFNTLVRAAWNQRELKRPTAAALYHKLADLLRTYGYNPPADLVVMTPSLGPQEPEESPV